MKMGWLPFTFNKHLGLIKRPSTLGKRQYTDEDRASRLRSACQFHVREIVFKNADRQAVLLKVRSKVPGFPTERYEQALNEAEDLVRTNRERARQRRAELVDAARKEDVLNAVFALRYFNQRYSGHVAEYDLGQVNIYESLRDLHNQAEIDAAVGSGRRTNQGCNKERRIRPRSRRGSNAGIEALPPGFQQPEPQ